MKRQNHTAKSGREQTKSQTLLWLSWQTVVLVILVAALTGLIVNFFNKVHYDSLVLRSNGQASSAQLELGKEQYDVKFLIKNYSKQLNCYDLRSNYARNICTAQASPASSNSL